MEDQTPSDKTQKEAAEKNVIPDQVKTKDVEVQAAQEYQEQNAELKDKLGKYGQTDVEKFIAKLGSDPIYAQQVVKDMLGVKTDAPLILGNTAGSPQEHNMTGILDHSTFPAKLKETPDASVEDGTPEKVG